MIHEFSELFTRGVLHFAQIAEIAALHPNNSVSLLADELQIDGLCRVVEAAGEGVSDARFVLRVDLIAGLTPEITFSLWGDLALAFRAANKVRLSLFVIHDSLDVARDLEVCRLTLSTEKLVILVNSVQHLFNKPVISLC